MGTVNDILKIRNVRGWFILDRDDGETYVIRDRREMNRFKRRYLEMFRTRGHWAFIILERIPGGNKQWKKSL